MLVQKGVREELGRTPQESCPNVVLKVRCARLALSMPVWTFSMKGFSAGEQAMMTEKVECAWVTIE